MAAPAMYRLAQKAFHPPPEPDSYGFWSDEDKWVDIPKRQWEKMTDEDADAIFEHNQQKKAHKKNAEGTWDNGEWKPNPRRPEPKLKHASVVTATDEEKQMTKLLETLFDFVENGEIPKEAMERAIYEMADSQISTDRVDQEKQEQLRRQEHEHEPD